MTVRQGDRLRDTAESGRLPGRPDGSVGSGRPWHDLRRQSRLLRCGPWPTLEVIEEERLLENAAAVGRFALERLADFSGGSRRSSATSGAGAHDRGGVRRARPEASLGRSAERDEAVPGPRAHPAGVRADKNVLRLAPPLVVREEEMARALDTLEAAVARVGRERAPGPAEGRHPGRRRAGLHDFNTVYRDDPRWRSSRSPPPRSPSSRTGSIRPRSPARCYPRNPHSSGVGAGRSRPAARADLVVLAYSDLSTRR